MADENLQNSAQEGVQPEFSVQKLYVKDLSFEAPNTPEVFQEEFRPQIQMEMNSKNRAVGNDLYEVVVSVTITAKNGDKTVYLAEVHQAGVFLVRGLDDIQMRHALMAFVPNVLFPYAREAVSDLVARGGFPQLLLQPVNFDALFAAQMQREAQQQAAAPEAVQ